MSETNPTPDGGSTEAPDVQVEGNVEGDVNTGDTNGGGDESAPDADQGESTGGGGDSQ